MDFLHLPDPVFLQIFKYLSLEDCIRVGRVDKSFRRIAQLTTSRTKFLDLTDMQSRNLTANQLAIILDLCSQYLERIKFPRCPRRIVWSDYAEYQEQLTIFGDYWEPIAITFANYECPRLIDIDLGNAVIDVDTFDQMIRNIPNLESLVWRNRFVAFPDFTCINLKKLKLDFLDDASLESLTGRCPNLKELDLSIENNITAPVLDGFFASIPQVYLIDLHMFENIGFDNQQIVLETQLVNFWNLPLTSLHIKYSRNNIPGDSVLFKVVASFPHLRNLFLGQLASTNAGVGELGALQELENLQLNTINLIDQGIRRLTCSKTLRKLSICYSKISANTLIALFQSCPQLEHIFVSDIERVNTPQKACRLLECLRLTNRDIMIEFRAVYQTEADRFDSIWETEPVKDMITKLEENARLKIRIDWSSWLNQNMKSLKDYFSVQRTIKKRGSGFLKDEKFLGSVALFVVKHLGPLGSSGKQVRKTRLNTLTNYYPVRRSSRTPESELKKVKRQKLEDSLLCEAEHGLHMCYMLGKGRGIMAAKPFIRGDFVVEYRGDLIDLTEAKRRESIYAQDPNVGCYMYYFHHKNQSYCVDATAETGYLGRLFNHSTKEPNCVGRVMEVNNRPHLILIAARDIALGEELLYDYGDRSRQSIEANPWLRNT